MDSPARVEVKGHTFNAIMPPWASRDDEEIAGVLTYVHRSFGNKADPVSPEFVALSREEVENKGEWKVATLNAFAASPSTARCDSFSACSGPGDRSASEE